MFLLLLFLTSMLAEYKASLLNWDKTKKENSVARLFFFLILNLQLCEVAVSCCRNVQRDSLVKVTYSLYWWLIDIWAVGSISLILTKNCVVTFHILYNTCGYLLKNGFSAHTFIVVMQACLTLNAVNGDWILQSILLVFVLTDMPNGAVL